MTEGKNFKRRVRARMSKTGEAYTAARDNLAKKRQAETAARTRLAADDDRVSDAKVQEATGRKWDEWFSLLDAWGARDRKHGEIARHLSDEHGVDGWWAQSVSVGYERARGMRLKHQRPEGFSVSASKTVAVPVEVLFAAFVDEAQRDRWLPRKAMSLRTSQPGRSARFDWQDGATRVNVTFTIKGDSKSVAGVEHARLAGADDAESMKAMWKERLSQLKTLLEG